MTKVTTKAATSKGKAGGKAARKKDRTIRLLARVPGMPAGMFSITEAGKTDRYFFSERPADFGRGFKVEKWSEAVRAVVQEYHVCLDGERSSCGCKGHLRWGHRTVCRHVPGLAALAEHGKL
jgi:hypothetical protein